MYFDALKNFLFLTCLALVVTFVMTLRFSVMKYYCWLIVVKHLKASIIAFEK